MTIQTTFNIAMDLLGERLDSGIIDATATKNYEVRTPSIITTLQNEIIKYSPLFDEITITETGTEGYQEITIPTDFYSVYQIIDTDLNTLSDFKIIGNKIYVPYDFEGTLVYVKIPTTITALSQTAEFDDSIMTTILPNGLASKLMSTENVKLSNYFGQVYEEMLSNLKRKNTIGNIIKEDVYNCTSIGV